MKHLAIFTPETAEKLMSGEKSFELRCSKYKIAPFGKVSSGDTVMVKRSGRKLIGQLRVGRVISFENPQEKEIAWIKRAFGRKLCLPKGFWREKTVIKFATLFEITTFSAFLTPPTKFAKRDRRGWVVLE
jgi:hypothetical protein